jgi:hypothetical protein
MADAPLMELEESYLFGMFPTRLLIFDDRIEVRGFELLREKVESRAYDRVERVSVSGEGWLANLVISEKGGGRPVLIRGVNREDAKRAGALIEDRVVRAGRDQTREAPPEATEEEDLIRSLQRLREAGVLSQEEFETKREGVRRERGTPPPGGL